MFDGVFLPALVLPAAIAALAGLFLLPVAILGFALLKYRFHLAGRDARLGLALIAAGLALAIAFAGLCLFALTGSALWPGTGAAVAPNVLTGGLASALLILAGAAVALRAALARCGALTAEKDTAELYNRRKSTFLASMSHELRTPLNAIIGFAEFLGHGPLAAKPERVQEYAGFIASSGEMLRRLIDDLLDLSRIEAGKYELSIESVCLAEIAQEVVTLNRPAAGEAGVALRTEMDCARQPVCADRRAVSQVLLNLVNNAIKFTPPGGSVCVTVASDEAGGGTITVLDTGRGIEPDLLGRIFEPFVHGPAEAAPSQKSYGLGLKICKDLIVLHGGTIEARSAPGAGTKMIVRLPARRAPANGGSPCARSPCAPDERLADVA